MYCNLVLTLSLIVLVCIGAFYGALSMFAKEAERQCAKRRPNER